jgi:hypothetical protein
MREPKRKFRIVWEACDGYAGGSRPQYLTARLDDFEKGQSLEEIKKILEDSIQDDFLGTVYWISENYEGVAAEIFDALEQEEA